MTTLLQIIGAVAVLAVLMIVIAWAGLAIQSIAERSRRRHSLDERHELGRRIYSDATWFGEHREAQKILQVLGIHLSQRGDYRPSDLRDSFEKGEV